jgi:predicted ATPase/DNA-binding winged helix-turn-helix (wHTH) protein
MELTGLCGQGVRLTLEFGQGKGYSRQPDEEPIVLVLAELIMPAEQRGQPSEIRVLFDPFELNVTERSLKKADHVIPLGGRAFDILLALVDRPGEVISKDELIAKAWPDVTVDEGSLRVHLSALRKALGDGGFGRRYIANVKPRGYCFVAPVTRQAAKDHKANSFARSSNLPPALSRMIGRDDIILEIRNRLETERLITVLGTGGIGKTTVGVAVGHSALAEFSGAVFFVDLSVVRDKEQVVGAIASAIGLVTQRVDLEDALFNYLHDRKALLILDSCEHLIEKAAEVADCLFQRAPALCMLATSRETLQIPCERVFHLHPLECPPEELGQTVAQVLSYPSVQLFVERVNARGNDFSLSDDEAPMVGEICRKLDGIALAIELAAARAAIFGLSDTVTRLGSRLDLLKLGRRTANPRHQTLRAMLDWSHDHLSEVEQVVLRRVAIFVGRFTLKAVLIVAEEEKGIGHSEVADAVGSLVEKSLIGNRFDYQEISYRLLDTTRSYALEKLIASGEHDTIAARHANLTIQFLEANSVDLFELGGSEAAADLARDYIGNVRAALEWSFGPKGNDGTAIRLAAAAAQLFLTMLLLLECRIWMERAIDRMIADCDPRHQMQVHAALALSLMFTEGSSERIRAEFDKALTFAKRREDAYQQLRLLSGLSMYLHAIIDVEGALEVALRSEAVAEKTGNPADAVIADSMLGVAYHGLGDQRRAQEHLEKAARSSPYARQFNTTQYLFDVRTLSLILLTRSYWFSGNLDQAIRYAEMTIEEAERSDHPIPLCRALMWTMPLYFWIDDLRNVEGNLSKLEITAEKHSLAPYWAAALGYKGQYLIRLGRTVDGMRLLRDGVEKLRNQRYELLTPDFVCELAVRLAKQGALAEGLALLDESIAIQVRAKKALHLPALFLAKGLAFASGDVPDLQPAEECFEKAVALARQSTLSLELRAGLELARIWMGRSEIQRVHDLIGPIYNRFSEGFATPDLILAKEMLNGKTPT